MIRGLNCLLGIILLMATLSGCWDYVDMKERTVVVGVGVDKVQGNEPILLSVQVVNLSALKPGNTGTGSGSGGGAGSERKNSVMVQTSGGKSLYDAINKFFAVSSRRITFAHNRIVVFGNELAKADVSGIIDQMARDYQFRMVNWIFFAERTAQEVLESQTDYGAIPAIEINHMMIDLTRNAFITPVNRNDFVFRLLGEGKASYAPLIEIESPNPNPTPRIKIEKTAVFNKNRLIAVLTAQESQGLLWFTERQKGSLVVIPSVSGRFLSPVSIKVHNGRTTMRPRRTSEGFVMEMTCTGDGFLQEINDYRNDSRTMAALEKKTALALKKQVEQTIYKAQQLKTDILGYAPIIHAVYPDVWRQIKSNWEQEFPKIKTEVRFRINIKHFGLIKDSQFKSSGRGG